MAWQDELRAYVASGGDPANYGGPAPDDAPPVYPGPRTLPREDTAPTQPARTPQPQQPKREEPKGQPKGKQRKGLTPAQAVALGKAVPTPAPFRAVGGAAERIAALPTPGGLFPLVAALLFFLFAIVPVGPQGSTRLELIWRALNGTAKIPAGPGSRRARIAQESLDPAVAAAADIAGALTSPNAQAVATGVEGVLGNWWNSWGFGG